MEDVKKYAQLLHSCGPVVSEEQDIIKITSKMAVGVLVEELVAGSSGDVESCMHDLKYAMETLGCADGQLSSAMQTVALHAEPRISQHGPHLPLRDVGAAPIAQKVFFIDAQSPPLGF